MNNVFNIVVFSVFRGFYPRHTRYECTWYYTYEPRGDVRSTVSWRSSPSGCAPRLYTRAPCLTLRPVVVLCYRARPNLLKNRYTDVLCYDHTRVLLAQSEKDPMSDYIHANFVDGYKQKNAFISTQGPLPHTCADYWRMVWEQQVLVIVMTTKVFECGKIKCEQYWPPDETSDDQTYQNFNVSTTSLSQFDNYAVTRLELTNTDVSIRRYIGHVTLLLGFRVTPGGALAHHLGFKLK